MNAGTVEVVKEFRYLGSLVEAVVGMICEVEHCFVQASRTFRSLCSWIVISILRPKDFCIAMWYWVCCYNYYGAETLAPT